MTTSRGIYIHIPFCIKKCAYCDFYSVSPDTDIILSYIDALCEEIREAGARYGDVPIDTLYIGGGTPALAGIRSLERVVNALDRYFLLDLDEFTVEVNPDDDNPYRALRALGANRLSMGVQCTDDAVLRVAGRRHDAATALGALGRACECFDNVSADIMLGLPEQAVAKATKSVDDILPFVKHVSAYMLKLSDSVPMSSALRRGEYALPDDDLTVDMYEAVYARLRERGMARYEISNFSLPGYESRHNLKYWRREEYIGLGAAAHSEIDDVRYANPASIVEYVSGKRLGRGAARGEPVSEDERIFEHIMLALRTAEGLDTAMLDKKFSINFRKRYADVLKNLAPLLVWRGDVLSIADDKLLLESAVVREFMI